VVCELLPNVAPTCDPANPVIKTILTLLLAAGFLAFAQQVHAQIIDGTTPYSFSNSAGVININGSNLLLEDYVGTDGGSLNDWVVGDYSEEEEGQGLDLEYAQLSAQWLTGGPVTFGTEIGADGTYSGNFDTPSSSFSDLYYGLDYTVSEGDVEYGWAEISYDSVSGTGTIVAAALDTTANENVSAGAVPEPSSYSLIGAGALALAMILRKRAA